MRLRDPRALQFLGKALEDASFAEDELYGAVLESYTPALGRVLHKLAASDESFRAQELLRLLKLAGVTRD